MGGVIRKLFFSKVSFFLKIIVILFMVTVISLFIREKSLAHESCREVLILNSYHKGYEWCEEVEKGINSVFSKTEFDINLYWEYMDYKRFPQSNLEEKIKDLIISKYPKGSLDLIITSDKEAFDFVLRYKKELFPLTPVVFLGLSPTSQTLPSGVTGVIEIPSWNDTLRVANELHTNLKKVITIGDTQTSSGKRYKQQFFQDTKVLRGLFEFIDLCDVPMDKLLVELEKYKQNSIIVPLSLLSESSSSERLITITQATKLIKSKQDIPIYVFYDFCLGGGAVGGNLVNSSLQGSEAAKIAIRILQGEFPDSIAPVKAENYYKFDFVELQRFNIKEDMLPIGSVLINSPEPYYKVSKEYFWIFVSFSSVLSLSLALLVLSHYKQKSIEQELRNSQQKYKKISREFQGVLDGIQDSLILISTEKNIVWANKRAEAFFGGKLSEVSGNICDKFCVCCEMLEKEGGCPAVRSLRTGVPEIANVTTRDEKNWQIRAFPLKDKDGLVVGVIEMASDITIEVLAQKEAVRSAHLASLGEVAAGVAHEINNPINGIISFAEILIDKFSTDTDESEMLQVIIDEGCRIADIVSNLLSYARTKKKQKAFFQIVDVINDTVNLVKSQLERDCIKINTEIPEDIPPVFVNKQQIQQVILNVINNSRYALNSKISRKNELKKINISADVFYENFNQYIKVVVEDNGVGVPAVLMDKIMEPFFSTKAINEGTGLGLSISYGIIEAHGGKISIESVENEYTKVSFSLPFYSLEQK